MEFVFKTNFKLSLILLRSCLCAALVVCGSCFSFNFLVYVILVILLCNLLKCHVWWQVSSVFLVVEPRTRVSRGFAFVTMSSIEDADRCIKYLNQSVLEGRYITVEKVSVLSFKYIL